MHEFKRIDDFIIFPELRSLEKELEKKREIREKRSFFSKCTSVDVAILSAYYLQISEEENYIAFVETESDNLFKRLVENSTNGIFVSTPDGKFLLVNQKLANIYHYGSKAEMLGIKNISEEIYCDTEIRHNLIKELHNGNLIEDFRFIGKCKDDKSILISKNVHPVCEGGKLAYCFGYVKDISNDIENTEIPTFKCDLDGNVIYANEAMAEWLGYTQDELLNAKAKDLYFDPKEQKHWMKILYEKRVLHNSPRTLKNQDGTPIEVHIDVSLETDRNNKDLYIHGQLNLEAGGAIKLPWSEKLKQLISKKAFELAANSINKFSRKMSLITLSDEEIRQLANVINRVINKNKNFEKNIKLNEFINEEFSFEKNIELEVWHSLNFFSKRKELLKNSLNVSQVAFQQKISEEDVINLIQDKKILGIKFNEEYHLPLWQFDFLSPCGVLKELPEILKALKMSDFAKLNWLSNINSTLDNLTPIKILITGKEKDKKRVVEEAIFVGGCHRD